MEGQRPISAAIEAHSEVTQFGDLNADQRYWKVYLNYGDPFSGWVTNTGDAQISMRLVYPNGIDSNHAPGSSSWSVARVDVSPGETTDLRYVATSSGSYVVEFVGTGATPTFRFAPVRIPYEWVASGTETVGNPTIDRANVMTGNGTGVLQNVRQLGDLNAQQRYWKLYLRPGDQVSLVVASMGDATLAFRWLAPTTTDATHTYGSGVGIVAATTVDPTTSGRLKIPVIQAAGYYVLEVLNVGSGALPRYQFGLLT